MTQRKKLIEVALPLEAINIASAREKSIRHGHPSTLHLWWARRPLAAARAVIFTSLVDDPDSEHAPEEFVDACKQLDGNQFNYENKYSAESDTPRMRLFDFIAHLVTWESTTDEKMLEKARELIRLSTDGNPPPLLDPFAGGGSIPLEAQRLGLEAHASDLNPVAVMINKAQIEIPPRFANMPPVNPRDRENDTGGDAVWKGAAGLAADVRYYGEWMRDKAYEKIGHLYPKMNGETVIAWIWARTVESPNPAIEAHTPLMRSFALGKKKDKEYWAKPLIDTKNNTVKFDVIKGKAPKKDDGTVDRSGGTCIISGVPIPFEYIRQEAQSGRLGAQLVGIITDGNGGRNYYSANEEHIEAANVNIPIDAPNTSLPEKALGFRVQNYGITEHYQLFTNRQLTALTTFNNLVEVVKKIIQQDAVKSGMPNDVEHLKDGGKAAFAYSEALAIYLTLAIGRLANRNATVCVWNTFGEKIEQVFARNALPMTWDFPEANPLSDSTGNWLGNMDWIAKVLENLPLVSPLTEVVQRDAAQQLDYDSEFIFSTDPPYYDNVPYADLSDFFYIWLRTNGRKVYPNIFGTMLVPKTPEIVADPIRHGSTEAANEHFEKGLENTFHNLRQKVNSNYPLTIYYAFKQSEIAVTDIGSDVSSTGWETMLQGVVNAGFLIDGTWPIRTERSGRMRATGSNALASSIVLVCRPRPEDAPQVSRREFVSLLRQELPPALIEMQSGNIAPVDLAQASIGPGMAVYSRYSQVLEADGTPLAVRTALQIINQELDAYLSETEGHIDADSRFAVAWFEQNSFEEGDFGQADVLARAKNTSVAGIEEAHIIESGRGKVRLLSVHDLYEMNPGWNPADDKRATTWEAVHHLIARLQRYGESGAALLMLKMDSDMAAEARQLAYRLYSICERKGWADHARDYNAIVVQWSDIQSEVVGQREALASGEKRSQAGLPGFDE